MSRNEYFAECLAESFDEQGIAVTKEQLQAIARDVELAHENIGMAFYEPPPGEYLTGENKRLERELKVERSKITCRRCGGSGRLEFTVGLWGVNTQCNDCHGEGKVLP